MAIPSSIPMRTAAGALLALLAIGMASPGTAQAGCLHRAGSSRVGSTHLEILADVSPSADLPASPIPAPSPCEGLRCSTDPAPTPSPAVATPERMERWGWIVAPPEPPPAGSTLAPSTTGTLRPSHGSPAPFHPPR